MADIKTVELILNSSQARQKLDELDKKLTEVRKKKEQAFEKGDAKGLQVYTREAKRLEKEMKGIETRATTVKKTLSAMDKSSPKELKKTLREINKELDSGRVERGTREWKQMQQAAKEVSAELAKIKQEQKAVTSLTDDIAEWGNKWMGIAMNMIAVQAGIDSVMGFANQSVSQFAEMDEHIANVMKYTGMAREEADALNDSFMKMDTRTPREKLNDLAADAGRLGIQERKLVQEFVEGANMINVALGEDLGEDAVKNIGKLAQLFGDADRMGLKKGMLANASVINELAQSSSAAEGYIMDFTQRMAGSGKTAGIATANIMAYASILDQASVHSEKAATALSQLIQKLFRDPSKMATEVGLDVQKFSKILKEDANAALVQWLEAVNKMGGMEKIAPMLGELQLTGAGVSDTIAALSQGIGNLKATQEQANKAFKDATSVEIEYSKANNTVLAKKEKAIEKALSKRVELGKRLQPIMENAMHIGSKTLSIMIATIDFAIEHRRTLTALAITWGVLTAAINANKIAVVAHAVATKASTVILGLHRAAHVAYVLTLTACTKGLKAMQLAFVGLNKTMKANVIGLVITGISALVVLLMELTEKEKALTEEQKKKLTLQKDLTAVQNDADKETSQQINRINILTNMIHDNNQELDVRRRAIEKLKAIIPGYNATITDEGVVTRETTAAVKEYVKELKKAATAKALLSKTDALTGDLLELEESKARRESAVRRRQRRLEDFRAANPDMDFFIKWAQDEKNASALWAQVGSKKREAVRLVLQLKEAEGWVRDINARIAETDQRITNLTETAKKMGVKVDEIVNSIDTDNNADFAGAGNGGKSLEDMLKEKVKAIRDAAAQKILVEELAEETGVIDHRTFSQRRVAIQRDMYDRIQALFRKNSQGWLVAEKERIEAEKKLKRETSAWSLADLQRAEKEEKTAITKKRAEGLLSEEEYQKALRKIRLKYLEKKASMFSQWGTSEEAEAAQKEYEDANIEEQLRRQEEFSRKVDTFKKEYLKLSLDEQMQLELNFADQLHEKGLLSEEEYQKALKAIREKFSKDRDQDSEYQWNLGGPNDPLSQGVVGLMNSIRDLHDKIREGKAGWQDYANVAIMSLGMVSAVASSASQLIQANLQAEQNKVNARYDAEVKKAGNNKKKTKKLEEARQKELAALKSKYAKKQMAMQITQAIASTAQNALMAYGSVLIPGVPWTYPLAAIAAAAAVASGMIQVAAIKKQAAAQQGYFEGGFTGGSRYRHEAGVVHEGEFVANHHAVNNPDVLPVLSLLDFAQKNNTISSLTAKDISQILPAQNAAANSSTVQIIDTSSARTADAVEKLNESLDQGIYAQVVIDGEYGLDRQWRRYNKLKSI